MIGELDPVVVGSGPVLHAWIRVADGRQSEVAQHILNEVLLRGDAAQCTQALDLRNAWLTPTHRQTDNEAK